MKGGFSFKFRLWVIKAHIMFYDLIIVRVSLTQYYCKLDNECSVYLCTNIHCITIQRTHANTVTLSSLCCTMSTLPDNADIPTIDLQIIEMHVDELCLNDKQIQDWIMNQTSQYGVLVINNDVLNTLETSLSGLSICFSKVLDAYDEEGIWLWWRGNC